MTRRDEILDTVQQLTLDTGRMPSIEAVARALGLSKQGVLHHFPSRSALDEAVVVRALEQVDSAMVHAAAEGSPLETYLRLSSPADEDRAAVLVVAAALRDGGGGLPPQVADAVRRWEDLITEEVGDAVLAEVVRLTGDGLFGEALVTGTAPSPERLDRLVALFRRAAQGYPS
ncbi:MAG TPA: TetR/AcrR family transcriptional regulator [Nocardioides sp.]|nr:TetR/AcrR family transcriptional regulator [Nocardioides sp.]